MNDLEELVLNEQDDVQFVHFRVNYEHIFDTIIEDYCPYLPNSEDRLVSTEINAERSPHYWEDFIIRYLQAERSPHYWEDFMIRYLQANLKDTIVKFLVDPLKFKSEEIRDVYDMVNEYSACTSKRIARGRILFLVLFMSKELGDDMHKILNDQLKIEVPIDLVEPFVKYLKIKYARELVSCINALVDDVKSDEQYKNSEIVMKAVRRAEMRLCVMRRDLKCRTLET